MLFLDNSLGEKLRLPHTSDNVVKETGSSLAITPTPEEMLQAYSGAALTIEEWRERARPHMDKAITNLKMETYRTPQEFASGGAFADIGREYAIAVFLPPVALGFSVVVCILHLSSMIIVLFGRAKLFTIMAFIVLIAPFILATSLPIQGFAGAYARWLVFWEAAFYPWGIFRPLLV